jgi:hypothetical protein
MLIAQKLPERFNQVRFLISSIARAGTYLAKKATASSRRPVERR